MGAKERTAGITKDRTAAVMVMAVAAIRAADMAAGATRGGTAVADTEAADMEAVDMEAATEAVGAEAMAAGATEALVTEAAVMAADTAVGAIRTNIDSVRETQNASNAMLPTKAARFVRTRVTPNKKSPSSACRSGSAIGR